MTKKIPKPSKVGKRKSLTTLKSTYPRSTKAGAELQKNVK